MRTNASQDNETTSLAVISIGHPSDLLQGSRCKVPPSDQLKADIR